MSDSPLEVACDESGSEGENVAESQHRVFSHGSVILSRDDATDVMNQLRSITGSASAELKSTTVLRSSAATDWLFDSDGPLAAKSLMVLIDKQYFLVAKVVDLLIEELAHARGYNLYAGDRARRMSWGLFREGPRALGPQMWGQLLASFNSLMRMRQRRGVKATVEEFFYLVDQAHRRSTRRNVSDALDLVLQARAHADQFQAFIAAHPDAVPSLDPLEAAITVTARGWADRSRGEVLLVHDTQALLTPERIAQTVQYLRHPGREFAWVADPIRLVDIRQVDSRSDPRVQVADIVAGAARWAATAALEGDEQPARLVRPFVSLGSIWADVDSYRALTGRPTPGR